MDPQYLITAVLGNEPRIVQAITAGAGWEVWMQVEFVLMCRDRQWQVAREVPYPQGNQVLDFLVSAAFGERTAVELKVESANNAGRAALRLFQNDVAKLANYNCDMLVDRYAMGIVYSDQAKQAYNEYSEQTVGAVYQTGQNIGVMIQDVPI